MAWMRLDDGVLDHPKHAALSPAALDVWLRALQHCARNLTDGKVPRALARAFAFAAAERAGNGATVDGLIAELTAVIDGQSNPLWHPGDDCYEIHDYLDYQPSRAAVLDRRDKERSRLQSKRRRGVARNTPPTSKQRRSDVAANSDASCAHVDGSRSRSRSQSPSRSPETKNRPSRGGGGPIPPDLDGAALRRDLAKLPELPAAYATIWPQWCQWVRWRRAEKRKAVTPTAAARSFAAWKRLGLSPATVARRIECCIRNDWQGLHEDGIRDADRLPWPREPVAERVVYDRAQPTPPIEAALQRLRTGLDPEDAKTFLEPCAVGLVDGAATLVAPTEHIAAILRDRGYELPVAAGEVR